MPNIRPITDLRNTTEISQLCHDSDEPIFITKNGYGDMVIMSNEVYEKNVLASEVYQKLLTAAQDIKNGAGTDGVAQLEKMRAKYGYDV